MRKEKLHIFVLVGLVCLAMTAGPGVLQAVAKQAEPVRIESAVCQESAGNALIADCEVVVDTPSTVWLQYWADGVQKLVSRMTDTEDAVHNFLIVRLRAETEYEFKAFAMSSEGETSPPFWGTFETGPLPTALQAFNINPVKGKFSVPMILLDHRGPGDWRGFVSLDSKGHIVWYYQGGEPVIGDIAQLPDGNFVFEGFGGILSPNHRMVVFTASGDLVSTSPRICGIEGPEQGGIHHEVIPLYNGKVLYLGREFRSEPFPFAGDTIREWDPVLGHDVLVWQTTDIFNPVDDYSTNVSETLQTCDGTRAFNWTHTNALAFGVTGNLVMSQRLMDGVVSIDAEYDENGDIVPGGLQWVLAAEEYNEFRSVPESKKFTFKRASDRFYHQHSVRQLPNGNILLFDNGDGRPDDEGGLYSRALELKLDFKKMEAKKVWEYKHPAPEGDPKHPTGWVFSQIVSSAFRLDNGNTLVCFGRDGTGSGTYRVVEADGGKDNTSVAEIELSGPGKGIQYRAHPLHSLYGESYTDE